VSVDSEFVYEGCRGGPVTAGEDQVGRWIRPRCSQGFVLPLFASARVVDDALPPFPTPIDIEAAMMLDSENTEARSLMSSLVPHARVVRVLTILPNRKWRGTTDIWQF